MKSTISKVQILKLAAVTLFALGTASAETGKSLPDFSKTFPKQMFLEETVIRSIAVYAYLTNKDFETLKAKFIKYIGTSWTEQEMDEETAAQIAAGAPGMKVTGSAIFRSEQFPETQLTLTQVQFQGQMMTSITVLDLSAIPLAEPE